MASRETEQEEVKRIADALLAYLKQHPQAADTLEGIRQWWLPNPKACSLDEVVHALEHLVAQGKIDKHLTPNGRYMYRRKHAV